MNLSTYDFTQDDLISNQRGFISAPQREWLHTIALGARGASKRSTRFLIVFFFVALSIYLAVILQIEGMREAVFASAHNAVALAGALPLLFAILAVGRAITLRQTAGLLETRLQVAEGEPLFDESSSSSSGITSYYVHIGGTRFSFSDDMSQVFTEGTRYGVYFCKSGVYQLILSMEQITG